MAIPAYRAGGGDSLPDAGALAMRHTTARCHTMPAAPDVAGRYARFEGLAKLATPQEVLSAWHWRQRAKCMPGPVTITNAQGQTRTQEVHMSTRTIEQVRAELATLNERRQALYAELKALKAGQPVVVPAKPVAQAKPRTVLKPASTVPAKPVMHVLAQAMVQPANRSAEHMASMRAARAAKAGAKPAVSKPVMQAKVQSAATVKAQAATRFTVRKPDGSLTRKTFASASEAQAWLLSWVNKAQAARYAVVGV